MGEFTTVSAPGKVLLTGGYLVLDRTYEGLVVGTSARFFTVIHPLGIPRQIRVRSPQFVDATWNYKWENELTAEDGANRNKFVEIALRYTLKVLRELASQQVEVVKEQGMDIWVLGSNDFYSQRERLEEMNLPFAFSSLGLLPPFAHTNTSLSAVHKTGLGSSAALITSLVGALFAHHSFPLTTEQNKIWVHNVAQFCHCFAQGKVGSGFDVSAGVWGSHSYRRFGPKGLESAMREDVQAVELLKTLAPESEIWDNSITSFRLSPTLTLMLADIDTGSHTPSMASKLLAWRKNHPEEADPLWNELGKNNKKIEMLFRHLTALQASNPEAYKHELSLCASRPSAEWAALSKEVDGDAVKALSEVSETFQGIRELIRRMTYLSSVPVEPPEQMRLLDACIRVPGVVMAGVPGAGGYDAIFCVVIGEEPRQAVEQVWRSWKEMRVCPLLAQESDSGIAEEKAEEIPGLLDAIKRS
ncbi:uncharacterized protein VTP21DRAFT_3804 [Calcarisporiella thermophila]|uniref:uncharacterized protein n=1 Tax=Calcarisporiella thermophila TaxID=911321 RepID=UPI003742609E